MHTIALIIPYFGRFNNYFHFWLESAKLNPSIDFHIYTDQQLNSIDNIIVHHTTFNELNKKIVHKLSMTLLDNGMPRINLGGAAKPYKLCDYKPVYGIIFDEDLRAYDFWGHCDVDLIFGDIRKFITEDILNKYDRILSHGHFTLYRNNPETDNMFILSRDNEIGIPSYEEVYTSNKSYCFDEWPGLSKLWSTMKPEKMYDQVIFDDINVYKGHFVSNYKVETGATGSNEIFEYANGHLFRHYSKEGKLGTEETLYAHFQKRNLEVQTSDYNHYLIVPNKFIDYQDLNIELLNKYGRKRIFYPHVIVLKYKSLKKKLKGEL